MSEFRISPTGSHAEPAARASEEEARGPSRPFSLPLGYQQYYGMTRGADQPLVRRGEPAVSPDPAQTPQPATPPPGGEEAPVPTGPGKIKLTVTTPLTQGSPISFSAKNYKELYEQVSARASQKLEAGSVTRVVTTDYKTLDDKVTEAKYEVALTMSLPSWPAKASQPQEDQQKFDTWAASVETHEDRHVAIYRTEFAKLKTAVVGPTEADCDKQEDAVSKAAEVAQDAFDASNQPAPLPPPGGIEKVGGAKRQTDENMVEEL